MRLTFVDRRDLETKRYKSNMKKEERKKNVDENEDRGYHTYGEKKEKWKGQWASRMRVIHHGRQGLETEWDDQYQMDGN